MQSAAGQINGDIPRLQAAQPARDRLTRMPALMVAVLAHQPANEDVGPPSHRQA